MSATDKDYGIKTAKAIHKFHTQSEAKIKVVIDSSKEPRDKLFELKELWRKKEISMNQFLISSGKIY